MDGKKAKKENLKLIVNLLISLFILLLCIFWCQGLSCFLCRLSLAGSYPASQILL